MHRFILALSLIAALATSGCATIAVTSAVVGTTATVAKVAVKGTVGAGKLVYRGSKAVVKGTARALSDDEQEQIERDRQILPDAD